ncbi:MAG TPA: spore coat U domain-containing protein [Gammaproteobacteria bacterium]|nr:spore coat U domain-containing protein [Gammaproteobacteria bacterium]
MMRFIFARSAACEGRVRRRDIVFAALLLLLLAYVPKPSYAASSCRNNGNLSVTVNSTGINFGNYDVLSSGNTPGTGSITVSATCDRSGLPFTVVFNVALSTGGSGTFTPRTMTSGTATLQYNLYTTAALTTIWGDGSSGTGTVSDQINGTCQFQIGNTGTVCSGGPQNDTIYGNIPALQDVVPGSYTDNITVTVTF